MPGGEILEDGRIVVTDGRKPDPAFCKFLSGVLQLDQLRFAKGSPISGTEKEEDGAVGSPERLIGLFVAELLNGGKGGRWPTGWQSNRRQDGRSCLLHRRHGGETQREKNCDCEFQLRLPGRPAGIW